MPTCDACLQTAIARLSWPASSGPQTMLACANCLSEWTERFRNTPAGLGVCIEQPQAEEATQEQPQ